MPSLYPFPSRECHCRFNRHTTLEYAVIKSIHVNLKIFSNFRYSSEKSEHIESPESFLGSSIYALLMRSCPAAISGLVISVVVYSIERLFFGFLSHIREKAFKRNSPTLANRNSSSSIIPKLMVLGIRASTLHSNPACIGGRFIHSVSCSSNPHFLRSRTSATLNSSRGQIADLVYPNFSAFALASPVISSHPQSKAFNNDQFSESHPEQVFRFPCHGGRVSVSRFSFQYK